jgi:hypothetical protein
MTTSKTLRILVLLATAFTLASQSAYASKTSGNIDLPIAGRPTAPAAIDWSAGLKAAAQTALQNKTRPGYAAITAGNVTIWVGTNFSNHHILPQTSLQALVQITQTSDDNISHTNQDWISIGQSLATIGAGAAAPLLTNVVWSPVNLFEGPTGYLRSDDPKSGTEPNKPRSFNQARWAALQEVNTKLNAVGALSSDGKKFVLNAKTLNAQGGLHNLADALKKLATVVANTAPTVQPFAADDWVDNNNRRLLLDDLVGYFENALVFNSLLLPKQSAYKLRTN